MRCVYLMRGLQGPKELTKSGSWLRTGGSGGFRERASTRRHECRCKECVRNGQARGWRKSVPERRKHRIQRPGRALALEECKAGSGHWVWRGSCKESRLETAEEGCRPVTLMNGLERYSEFSWKPLEGYVESRDVIYSDLPLRNITLAKSSISVGVANSVIPSTSVSWHS